MDVSNLFCDEYGVIVLPSTSSAHQQQQQQEDGGSGGVSLASAAQEDTQWLTDSGGPILLTFSTINSIPIEKQDSENSTAFLNYVPSLYLSGDTLLTGVADGSPQTLTLVEPSIREDSPQTVISIDSAALEGHQAVESIIDPVNQDSSPLPLMAEETVVASDGGSATISGYSMADLADVITLYKCKLCHFHCENQAVLSGHFAADHVDGGGSLILEKPSGPGSNSVGDTEEDPASPNPTTPPVRDRRKKRPNTAGTKMKERVKVVKVSEPKAAEGASNVFFSCGSCHKVCTTMSSLKTHMITVHAVKKDVEEEEVEDEEVESLEVVSKTGAVEIELSESDVIESITSAAGDKEGRKRATKPLAASTSLPFVSKSFKYTCAQCNARFSCAPNLEKHSMCHNTNGDAKFKCLLCERSYERWVYCAGHLWLQHKVAIDLFSCHICDYKTAVKDKFFHHQLIHQKSKEFGCKICHKMFTQKTQLRNHEVTHRKKNADAKLPEWAKPKECDHCHKTFSDSKSLKTHVKVVHSKLKPYICQVCGHCSSKKGMFQLHIRQHTGEKPYACQYCEFKSGDHNSLRRHTMRHTGARQYQCKLCDYSAIQAQLFKLHLIKFHGGDGVFLCNVCSFSTLNEKAFIYHHHDDHHPKQEKETEDPPTLIYVPYNERDSNNKTGSGELIAIDLPADDEESISFFDSETMIDTGGITIAEDDLKPEESTASEPVPMDADAGTSSAAGVDKKYSASVKSAPLRPS